LWFLDRLEGSGAAAEAGDGGGGALRPSTYVIPVAVRLKGALDRGALRGAIGDVVERHESLRTRFPERGGVPRQEIVSASAASFALEERGLAAGEVAAAVAAAAGRGFDLAQELPLRVYLFEVAADEHVLLLCLHHIAGDGWSLRVLWRGLAAFYRARCGGAVSGSAVLAASGLAPLGIQYADYTLWQQRVLGGDGASEGGLSGQLSYWRERLAGLPDRIELPFDHARPAVSSHRGGRVGFVIDAAL